MKGVKETIMNKRLSEKENEELGVSDYNRLVTETNFKAADINDLSADIDLFECAFLLFQWDATANWLNFKVKKVGQMGLHATLHTNIAREYEADWEAEAADCYIPDEDPEQPPIQEGTQYIINDGGAPIVTPSQVFAMDKSDELEFSMNFYELHTVTLTRTDNIVTATTTYHTYKDNDFVTIAGADQEEYNGGFGIRYISDAQFSYQLDATPATPATGTITSEHNIHALFEVYIRRQDTGTFKDKLIVTNHIPYTIC